MSKIISLSRGLAGLVDDEDYPAVSAYRWHAKPARSRTLRFYVFTHIGGQTVYLHRFILAAKKGDVIDHINNDGLDNRRCNLRFCTLSLNNANKRTYSPQSGFRGVYPRPSGKWRAAISCGGGRLIYLGLFDEVEEAARAYDKKAREFFHEFATLNFP